MLEGDFWLAGNTDKVTVYHIKRILNPTQRGFCVTVGTCLFTNTLKHDKAYTVADTRRLILINKTIDSDQTCLTSKSTITRYFKSSNRPREGGNQL